MRTWMRTGASSSASGINVGDIIIDGDDIFGDGVNIAARLEALCEPGGVCISRAANDQIRDKLSLAFADLGEQTVKNISRAVGVFGLASERDQQRCRSPNSLNPLLISQQPTLNGPSRGTSRRFQFCQHARRRATRLFTHGQWTTVGQNRKLDDASRIRFREPDLAASLSRAVAGPHSDPLRRTRQRPLGPRCRRRFVRNVCG